MKKQDEILKVLSKALRFRLEEGQFKLEELEEIRLRVGKPVYLKKRGTEQMLPHYITAVEIKEILNYMSQYSLYAYEEELRKGFLTIEGGHRIGVAGKVLLENDRVKNFQHISSLNIRIAHEVKGCADPILPFLAKDEQLCHTLLISPPGGGKTTLLRDVIRQVSDGCRYIRGCTVAVVDERSEIGGCCQGVPQNDLGKRTDLLDGCLKEEGMLMLVRSMAPDVLAVDEIGSAADVKAVEYAMQCGCKMLATIHGTSFRELSKKPHVRTLVEEERFERYVVLKHHHLPGVMEGVYDSRGVRCC